VSGRGGTGGWRGGVGEGIAGAPRGSAEAAGAMRADGSVGGLSAERRRHHAASAGAGTDAEISWGDIGNGGVLDPALSATRLNSLTINGGGGSRIRTPGGAHIGAHHGQAAARGGGGAGPTHTDPAHAARAEKLLARDVRERRLLEYVQGTTDMAAIRLGTPRTPPSRPPSRLQPKS
jgi:hypothetical protein